MSEVVSQGASHQEQGRQQERIDLDYPLRLRKRSSEIALDRGQRNVGHGSVDKGHAGTEDGRGEYPVSQDLGIRVIVSGLREMVMVYFVWMLGNVTHGCPSIRLLENHRRVALIHPTS